MNRRSVGPLVCTLTRLAEQWQFDDEEYENAGGDRVVPARACKPCVPPLRGARYQSFMK